VVICLERGADLHMAQLIPPPLTVSCFSKIQIGFAFLVPAHPGSPGKSAVKRVCVCITRGVGKGMVELDGWSNQSRRGRDERGKGRRSVSTPTGYVLSDMSAVVAPMTDGTERGRLTLTRSPGDIQTLMTCPSSGFVLGSLRHTSPSCAERRRITTTEQ